MTLEQLRQARALLSVANVAPRDRVLVIPYRLEDVQAYLHAPECLCATESCDAGIEADDRDAEAAD